MAEMQKDVLERITDWRGKAVVVALASLAVAVALGFIAVGTGPLVRALLISFVWPLGLTLGSLVLLMIQYCTGGYWGYVMRRSLEAATRTLPALGVIFALIAVLGLTGFFHLVPDGVVNENPRLNAVSTEKLWPWADETVHMEHHEELVLEAKKGYLNIPFFAIRAVGAFALWIALAMALGNVARREDAEGTSQKLRDSGLFFSGPGIVLYSISILFVSTDWSMSLQPLWFSSMFPVIFGFGQLVGALAFNTLLFVLIRTGREDLSSSRNKKIMRDLGSLLLGFLIFWTYISFSQYLLIWSTNLKEEVPFFIARSSGGWELLSWVLALGHFVIPFFVLLLRDVSRSGKWLAIMAGFMVLMRFVDIYWQMKPAFRPGDWNFASLETVMDMAAAVGLLGLWFWLYLGQLAKFDLLPANDDRKATEPVHTVSDDVEIAGISHAR